jgi:hypothetical protein
MSLLARATEAGAGTAVAKVARAATMAALNAFWQRHGLHYLLGQPVAKVRVRILRLAFTYGRWQIDDALKLLRSSGNWLPSIRIAHLSSSTISLGVFFVSERESGIASFRNFIFL